ncbi:uncharacterized protein RCH25_042656 [Pelodytes ibericus]
MSHCSGLPVQLSTISDEDAKSCSDCHATASDCAIKTDYVVCTCSPGYIGNGVNCTAITLCSTQSCCPTGYYWDDRAGYKTCTDINECADNTLNKCIPSTTCINKNGFHLCSTSRSITCSTSVCPFDQDCVNVGGTVQCADPCANYQTVNGTSRLSTLNSTGVFATDRFTFGWVRYIGDAGLRMQLGCTGSLKCGSFEPFSLNGTHPTIGEGVKLVPLVINSLAGCVNGPSIPVKACPGNFYIYKFTGSLKYDVFCTDPTFNAASVIPTMAPTTTAPTTTTPTTTTTTPTTTTTTPTTTTTTPTTTTTTPTTTTTTPTTTTTTPTTTTTTPPTTTTTTPTTTTTTPTSTTTTPTTTTTTPTTTTTTPTTTTTTPTTTTTTPTTTTSPTTTTTTPPTTTTTTPPPTTPQSEQNITVTTVRSSSVVSVTTSTETVNSTELTHLEINTTTIVYIEVQTITPSTIRTKSNNSVSLSSILIMSGGEEPVTLTEAPSPQLTSNETVVANAKLFQPSLYSSKPAGTKTLTETYTVPMGTITTTTITTEEVIVQY